MSAVSSHVYNMVHVSSQFRRSMNPLSPCFLNHQ